MTATKKIHIGRNIARLREIKGMKQDILAEELGISQQSVSHLEQSETLEEKKLEDVAKALGVTKEAIENFSEEAILNIIGNTYNVDNSSAVNFACTINPVEKLVDAYEENKKLYERLIQAEKDKVVYLEKLLNK